MISERIEGRLDLLLVGDLATIGAEPLEKGGAKQIAGEKAVQIASGDSAVAADATIAAADQTEHRPLELGPGRAAEMHLVAFDRHTRGKLDSGGLDEPLGTAEHSVDLRNRACLWYAGQRLRDASR